jgi:hypothetical protein
MFAHYTNFVKPEASSKLRNCCSYAHTLYFEWLSYRRELLAGIAALNAKRRFSVSRYDQ